MDKFITLQVQQISATQQQVCSRCPPHAAHHANPYGSGRLGRCSSHLLHSHLSCVYAECCPSAAPGVRNTSAYSNPVAVSCCMHMAVAEACSGLFVHEPC